MEMLAYISIIIIKKMSIIHLPSLLTLQCNYHLNIHYHHLHHHFPILFLNIKMIDKTKLMNLNFLILKAILNLKPFLDELIKRVHFLIPKHSNYFNKHPKVQILLVHH